MIRVHVWLAGDGWRVRISGSNGEPLFSGEGWRAVADAEHALRLTVGRARLRAVKLAGRYSTEPPP